jgi:hypothetical protein
MKPRQVTEDELAELNDAINDAEAARTQADAVTARLRQACKVPSGWKLNPTTREWLSPEDQSALQNPTMPMRPPVAMGPMPTNGFARRLQKGKRA